MAEKILKTIVQLRYDSYDAWMQANPVLRAGEIAVAAIPTQTQNTADGIVAGNTPAIMLKAGDGTHTFSELKWMSGLGADSYAWAKAPQKPSYSANEIEGLADYISGEIKDTNTQYKLVADGENKWKLQQKDVNDDTYTDVIGGAAIDLTDMASAIEALEAAIGEDGSVQASITAAISNLNFEGVTAAAGEIVESVSQTNGVVTAKTRALTKADIPNIDQSQVNGLGEALDGKQAALDFDGTYNSVSNKVATQSTVTTAIEALDKDDSAVEGEFVTAVSESNGVITVTRAGLKASDIPTLAIEKVDGLRGAIDGKQDKLEIADEYNAATNKVATEATITKMIADLNGAMHFEGKVEGATFEAAVAAKPNYTPAAGDVLLYGYDEYVFDGEEWHTLGNESIYKTKTEANSEHEAMAADIDALETAVAGKQDALQFGTAYDAANNKVATIADTTNAANAAINTLNSSVDAKDKQFITSVKLTNGAITADQRALVAADIPNIGLSQVVNADGTKDLAALLAEKQNVLSFDGEYNAETNKVATKSTVDNAINALDNNDAKVAHQFVTLAAQENGVVTVERAQPSYEDISGLAAIAHSGNVNDLVQSADDVLVFQCGGAD